MTAAHTAAHRQHDHAGHDHSCHSPDMMGEFKQRFFVSSLVTIPILALSPTVQHLLSYQWQFAGNMLVMLALSTFVFVYGGHPFITGLIDELKSRSPGMMTLIGLAIIVAYLYSGVTAIRVTLQSDHSAKTFFWELATLIDIMLLGHWIEAKSVLGASKALESLSELLPKTAHRIDGEGQTTDVALHELSKGARVLIKPGEKIPSDGVVCDGASTVDESLLTGESTPVSKVRGDTVIAGSINGSGSLVCEIQRTGADSYLSQVIQLVQTAQASKSKTQSLADRAALILTMVAIIAGVSALVIWLATGAGLAFALERMVTVMIITCPHALGLAIPLVVAVSTSISARNGFLIRNRTAFENARNIDVVVFDKTGTLTEGRFGVVDVVSTSDLETDEILSLAAAVENYSEHPIAGGIVAEANKRGLTLHPVVDFESIPGMGAGGVVLKKSVRVVGPNYFKDRKEQLETVSFSHQAREGQTIVFVMIGDIIVGGIVLADVIRPESKQAIKELQAMGIKCVMLTGDSSIVAQWVANELGLDDHIARCLPHEKAEHIKRIQSSGRIVAMTGDGVNDAPALAQADVGIAIGAGTDVAAASSDIILVDNNPCAVPAAIRLGRATYKKMAQNLAWATGYNVIAIPLAAGVLSSAGFILSPAVGAVLMSLSTVVVAINARFLKVD